MSDTTQNKEDDAANQLAMLPGNSNSFKNLHKQGSELKKIGKNFNLVTKTDSYSIDPYAIVEDVGYNPRGGGVMTEEEYFSQPSVIDYIMGIARAYAHGDYVEPIRVQILNNIPHLRQGAHRIRAVKIAIEQLGAEIRRIQVIESQGDEASQGLQQLTGNMGKDFSPLSKAIMYDRFVSRWGWTEDELATRLNASKGHIAQTLKLLDLPLGIRRMIVNEQITATEAVNQFKLHGENTESILLASIQNAKNNGKDRITGKSIPSPHASNKVSKKITNKIISSFGSIGHWFENPKEEGDDVVINIRMSRAELAAFRELQETIKNSQLNEELAKEKNKN